MSRQSMAPQRSLTLTEELERLEQSITLTLQEIDQNFSRAHRIVTTNILPVVAQYGKHSEAVWEGSKFWKQFFEASANVSLSGYEAADESMTHDEMHEDTQQEETQVTQTYDDMDADDTVTGATATPPRPSSAHAEEYDHSVLDSPSLAHAHSTPRAPPHSSAGHHYAQSDFSSPYETLRHNITVDQSGMGTPMGPTTPGKAEALPDMSLLESSPFRAPPSSTKGKGPLHKDPVLHHMLDKTYRIAATPHTATKTKNVYGGYGGGNTPGTARKGGAGAGAASKKLWDLDSSPMSSPEPQAPQLRAELFSSPLKGGGGPRTPGVSVQTPAKYRPAFNLNTARTPGLFDSDSDGEGDDMGFSPPKTMQFHIPKNTLLQTPAREASRRIVEDLLMTAGAELTDTTGGMAEEDSPSVVRRQIDLDDSF